MRHPILNDCLLIKQRTLSSGQSVLDAAIEMKTGVPRPSGHQVVHLCGNEQCCNPFHLMSDTSQRLSGILNSADYVYQPPTGEQNVNSKLTEEDVLLIVELLLNEVPQREIARRFGTTQQAISSISTGRTWSEVTGFTKPNAEDIWSRLTR
jgi:hypothetical protein